MINNLIIASSLVVIAYVCIYFLLKIINKTRFFDRSEHAKDVMTVLVKYGIWGLTLLLILDNIGVKISTLVAGLGVGGIAIALASQTILGDLINYFAIIFDRPFDVGDHIDIGDISGVVTKIGLKTTRLKGQDGEEVIIANSDISKARIKNFGKKS